MDARFFPCHRYYRDGRQVVVHSQQELDALAPGSAANRAGPWDDGFDGEPPWEPSQGPFAPDTESQRYDAPPDARDGLYATRPVICNGWARDVGEVFRRASPFEEETLLLQGAVRQALGGRCCRHEPTSRWFVDERTRDAYARRYEAGDVSGFVVAQEPATPGSRPGRPEDAAWRKWTFDELLEMLKIGWQQAQKKHPNKKRPSFQDVADCLGYARKPIYESLRSFNHTWETIRPFLQK
jgi:hypothetical protein